MKYNYTNVIIMFNNNSNNSKLILYNRKIEKYAIAYKDNEIMTVVDNGGEIFAPSDVNIVEFTTRDEMNSFIDEHNLVYVES